MRRSADTTGARAGASAFDGRLLVRAPAAAWTGTATRTGVSVLVEGDRIAWIGPDADAPRADETLDARGHILLPGLVDPHTHTVHAGSRVEEFARRLAGASYTEILEAGGGIHATVRAVRAADEAELTRLARARLDGMLAGGVTTVEIKSGYGLTPADEAKMLRAARAASGPVEVVPTFLGAHARPPGRDDYVDEVVGPQLDACRGLAVGIDVYCDRGAFTLAETERILRAGRDAGLALHVHAEQVAHTGAAALAASLGALSADHLERIDDAGIRAMASAGTVAVLLPGAMLTLRDTAPPVARLRAAGVRIAVGTDFNPGSSPLRDLLGCAGLACVTMGLTAEEALAGVTAHAADALGRPDLGRLEVGARADLALFAPPPGEAADPRVLVQYLGGHAATWVCKGGVTVRCASAGIG